MGRPQAGLDLKGSPNQRDRFLEKSVIEEQPSEQMKSVGMLGDVTQNLEIGIPRLGHPTGTVMLHRLGEQKVDVGGRYYQERPPPDGPVNRSESAATATATPIFLMFPSAIKPLPPTLLREPAVCRPQLPGALAVRSRKRMASALWPTARWPQSARIYFARSTASICSGFKNRSA